ncbi:MAG: hypothetical protein ABI047_06120 [Jatrophihabitantaceae bacterium]
MPDPEFGIEVPEADRLEQLRDAEPAEHAQEDPPVFDTGSANPADVFEQQIEVPRATTRTGEPPAGSLADQLIRSTTLPSG